jgi:hypothetical protein
VHDDAQTDRHVEGTIREVEGVRVTAAKIDRGAFFTGALPGDRQHFF